MFFEILRVWGSVLDQAVWLLYVHLKCTAKIAQIAADRAALGELELLCMAGPAGRVMLTCKLKLFSIMKQI